METWSIRGSVKKKKRAMFHLEQVECYFLFRKSSAIFFSEKAEVRKANREAVREMAAMQGPLAQLVRAHP
jgi:hypothetical protein